MKTSMLTAQPSPPAQIKVHPRFPHHMTYSEIRYKRSTRSVVENAGVPLKSNVYSGNFSFFNAKLALNLT
jgi:hypothetical protein